MNLKWIMTTGAATLLLAQEPRAQIIRLAELEIHAEHLEAYQAELKEEIETSVRVEPGVLTLYAVSVKGQPSQIRIFEVYANAAAYQSHIQTPHFRKYKVATEKMIKSLKLIDTDPILLRGKSK